MKVKSVNTGILTLAASLLSVTSAFGAKVTKLPDDAFAPLRGSVVVKKIRIDRLPIYDNTKAVIDLDEVQVRAPGGKVVIHGENGKVLQKLEPPAKRC